MPNCRPYCRRIFSPASRSPSFRIAENPGYAGGINRCLAARPDAEIYWLLNPDTVPDGSALQQLLLRYKEGNCDAIGGVVHLPSGRIQSCGGNWDRHFAYSRSIGHGDDLGERPDRSDVESRLSFISGASILFSQRFLQTAGPMREDYFLYGEEVEWCLRATSRGMQLGYTPDALIGHKQGTSTGSDDSINTRGKLPIYFDERNRVLTVRDTRPGDLAIAIPGSFATLVLRYARRRAWRQFGYAVQGWWAGVRNMRGKPAWFTDGER